MLLRSQNRNFDRARDQTDQRNLINSVNCSADQARLLTLHEHLKNDEDAGRHDDRRYEIRPERADLHQVKEAHEKQQVADPSHQGDQREDSDILRE